MGKRVLPDELQAGPRAQPEADKDFWAGQWTATGIPHPDTPTWYRRIHLTLLDFLRPHLPESGTVAEFGCGSARLLGRVGLERPDLKLVALDYDASAVELAENLARAWGLTMETRLGDVTALDVADDTYDMILSGGLLEHFPDPRPALREMVRTLKPGGYLFATIVPRKLFSLHRPLHRLLGPRVERTSYRGPRYAAWLEDLGMEEVVAVSKGVYPPLFHHLPPPIRDPIERMGRTLDGTWIADRLGFFFIIGATKPTSTDGTESIPASR